MPAGAFINDGRQGTEHARFAQRATSLRTVELVEDCL